MLGAYAPVYFSAVLRDTVGNLNEQYNKKKTYLKSTWMLSKSYKQSYKVSYS